MEAHAVTRYLEKEKKLNDIDFNNEHGHEGLWKVKVAEGVNLWINADSDIIHLLHVKLPHFS